MSSRLVSLFVIMVSFGVGAQPPAQLDSATMWSKITELEDRYLADFPKTFREVEKLFQQALTSTCERCKGRAYMMYGKFFWANGQYQDALPNFRKAVKIANELKDYDTWSKSVDLIGNTFYYQAYYDSAEFYFNQAYKIAETQEDTGAMIMILHNNSLMYHRKGDFGKAIQYIFKGEKLKHAIPHSGHYVEAMGAMGALMIDSIYYKGVIDLELDNVKHYSSNGDLMSLYHTYQNLGKSYRAIQDHLMAGRFFVMACEVMAKIDLLPDWDWAGVDFREAGMKDSCFYYHYKAKANFDKATRSNAAYTLQSLGDAHLRFGSLDSAIYYYNSALQISYLLNNRIATAGMYDNIVAVNTLLERYEEAEMHLIRGLTLAKDVSLIHEMNLYKEAKKLYEKKGDFKKALFYSEKFKDYLDSINRQETAINLIRLQAEFDNTKKESELARLSQANLLNEEKIKTRNLQVGLALACVILAGSFGLWFYNRFRHNKRQSDQLKRKNNIIENQYAVVQRQNKEKESLLHEIHHRVKNNLQIISSLMSLKGKSAQPETQEILKDLNTRIHSLGLVHEMLYRSDHLGAVNLKEYLSEQAQLTLNSLGSDKSIELKLDIEASEVNVDQALAFGLISNELMTNSIKYAFAPSQPVKEIFVSLHRNAEHWVFSVADNGTQLADGHAIEKSFGLRFVEQLVRSKLQGTLKVEVKNGLRVDMMVLPSSDQLNAIPLEADGVRQ